jgi:hypothetical protein
MTKDSFPYETDSQWVQDLDTKRKWSRTLEDTGVAIVRATLTLDRHGSAASIPIGGVFMTRGFAEQWLAWHDRKQSASDKTFRAKQIFWPKWAAIVLTISAMGGLIAWMIKYL